MVIIFLISQSLLMLTVSDNKIHQQLLSRVMKNRLLENANSYVKISCASAHAKQGLIGFRCPECTCLSYIDSKFKSSLQSLCGAVQYIAVRGSEDRNSLEETVVRTKGQRRSTESRPALISLEIS